MSNVEPINRHVRLPSLTEALIPIVFMMFSLAVAIFFLDAEPHIPLLLSAGVAAIVALRLGFHWKEIEKGMLDSVRLALQAIVILMVIGTIIGSWIAAGIVPTLIYYGLDIMSPTYFYFAACLICSVVSIASGNAWTAAGTIGIAVMGVGIGLGMNPAIVAGAVVSGVYFGDKVSPLSETTNLAPGIVGVDLFSHIRYMLYTTIPGLLISLTIYLGIGLVQGGAGSEEIATISELQTQLSNLFVITPWLLLVPVFIIVLMVFKIPAFPGLTIGSMLGIICALFVQGIEPTAALDILTSGYDVEVHNPQVLAYFGDASANIASSGNEIVGHFLEARADESGTSAVINELLNNGGIEAVLLTVSLIIFAMCFGGVLEFTKMFEVIVARIMTFAKSTGRLITTTVVTCVSANAISCDQYMAIIVPARMYAEEYEKRGLKAKVLSRTVEDAGTMTSPLIPWNTCGAFMTATLGVNSLSYLPYTYLCLLSPVIAIIYGVTGFGIEYMEGGEEDAEDYIPTEFIEKRLD